MSDPARFCSPWEFVWLPFFSDDSVSFEFMLVSAPRWGRFLLWSSLLDDHDVGMLFVFYFRLSVAIS